MNEWTGMWTDSMSFTKVKVNLLFSSPNFKELK